MKKLYFCGFMEDANPTKVTEGADFTDSILRLTNSLLKPLYLKCSCNISEETKYVLTKNFLYYTNGNRLMRHDIKSSLDKQKGKDVVDSEIINTSSSGNQTITSLHASSNFVSVVLKGIENEKSITLTVSDDGSSSTFETGEDDDVCEFKFGNQFGLFRTAKKKLFFLDSKCLKNDNIDMKELSVPNLSSIRSIACGKEHALVLTEGFKISTIGGGSRGQLGNGSTDYSSTLSEVTSLEPLQIDKISVGGWHSLVISNGDLYGWGWNESGQIGCAATDDDDESMKVTEDNIPKLLFEPTLVDTPMDKLFTHVSTGSRHSAAVTTDGMLYTWGWNAYGQLCHGDQENRLTPCKVSCFDGQEVKSVQCSDWATLVVIPG